MKVKPDRGQMTEAGKIVAPVRIDDGHGRRQHLIGLVVIDDDNVDTERARFRQRLDTGRAAIDRHQKRRAAPGERAHRLDVRAIAFEQPVGNVDQGVDAGMTQEAREQRGGCRAVDVVIAEYGDRLAAHDRVGDTLGRLRHGGEHVGIGHRLLDRRVEECRDRIDLDIAAGEDARQQFGKIVPLRDRERARRATLVEPVAPRAPGRRVFDAEKKAVVVHREIARFEAHRIILADSRRIGSIVSIVDSQTRR